MVLHYTSQDLLSESLCVCTHMYTQSYKQHNHSKTQVQCVLGRPEHIYHWAVVYPSYLALPMHLIEMIKNQNRSSSSFVTFCSVTGKQQAFRYLERTPKQVFNLLSKKKIAHSCFLKYMSCK